VRAARPAHRSAHRRYAATPCAPSGGGSGNGSSSSPIGCRSPTLAAHRNRLTRRSLPEILHSDCHAEHLGLEREPEMFLDHRRKPTSCSSWSCTSTVASAIRPSSSDLRDLADELAQARLSTEDRMVVAGDVADALQGLDIDELNGRAGPQPGRGYVHPGEAADEVLDEALQPFLDDLNRRAALGMRSAAVELATGILLGLYECRDGGAESLLEYSPDYAGERASEVVDRCRKLGIVLPATELLDLVPDWDGMLR
jgi:hypothetical protein